MDLKITFSEIQLTSRVLTVSSNLKCCSESSDVKATPRQHF